MAKVTDKLFNSLARRGAFNHTTAAFKNNDISAPGVSWAIKKEKFCSLLVNEKARENLLPVLQYIYVDHLLYSQEAVSFWVVKTEQAHHLAAGLHLLVDAKNPYCSYPFLEDDDTLHTIQAQRLPVGTHDD